MRITARQTLLLTALLAASLGGVLLVSECYLLSIPVGVKKRFGMGSWLLDVAVYHYGIPATAIFIVLAFAVVVILAVAELIRLASPVAKN
jgi:hypothetical protein